MNIDNVVVHRILKFNCEPDWHWNKNPISPWPNTHAERGSDKYFWNYNLWIISKGLGHLNARHSDWSLQRGDIFLLRGDEAYFGRHSPENPLVVIAIHFDFLDPYGKIKTPQKLPFHHHFESLMFFETILKRIEEAWTCGQVNNSAIWMKACLTEFINKEEQTPFELHNPQEAIIHEICDEIRKNPAKQYLLEEFAQRLHCSPRHFNRRFKQFIGVTPIEFILTMKLESAKDMLLSSSLSIGRIAESLGFRDVYYFSKWFKSQTGLPPSQYRP